MGQDIKHLSDQDFESSVATGVTLVDFYADWCGPCKMIAPVIEELATELKGSANVVKFNIEENQNMTASLQVMSIPTLILFKDGKEVKRVVGIKNKKELLELVNSAL
jgi:thioredoxin 1